MELTKQERELEKSTAESFFTLSVGLWSLALAGYLAPGISCFVYLLIVLVIALGVLSALFSIYLSIHLVFHWDWKQKSVLKCLETKQIMKFTKPFGWLLLLGGFSIRLVQTKVGCLVVTGLIFVIIAYVFFYVGLWRAGTDYRKGKRLKGVKQMGSKGRKSIKKPKMTKEQKEAKKKR